MIKDCPWLVKRGEPRNAVFPAFFRFPSPRKPVNKGFEGIGDQRGGVYSPITRSIARRQTAQNPAVVRVNMMQSDCAR